MQIHVARFTTILLLLIEGAMDLAAARSLNGTWLFKYDPEGRGDQMEYYRLDCARSTWQSVNVPAFWDDPSYDGIGWYACTFRVSPEEAQANLALVFEAVDDNAVIYLNSKKIYEHNGANLEFSIEIKPYVLLDRDNVLVVRIEDTGGTGGINGNVWLKPFQERQELYQTEYFQQSALPVPSWLDEAVIYEIFPRVFSPAGDLKSIQTALPRLQELGVNCLWLMPIFPIGAQQRKGPYGSPYATSDYLDVDPMLGTKHDLKQLVIAAHHRNMRLILDIACNHCAWDNWLLTEHPEWFTQDPQGKIVSPNTDWTDVADFNYANLGLREYMWQVLEYWVREFDIDGYRLDVAELVPDDFWEVALQRLQKIKPDVLMLAEGEHPRLHTVGFHLTYAWNLRRALYRVIKRQESAQIIYETIEREKYRYPQGSRRMRFIENHDEERARQLFGDEASQVAAVIAYTLPGIPLLYAGQEFGAQTKPSLFEKQDLDAVGRETAYYDFYRQLMRIRQQNPVLITGEFLPVNNTQKDDVVSFCRREQDAALLIVANLRPYQVDATIELPAFLPKNPQVILGPAKLTRREPVAIKLQSWQWVIIKLAK